jgi:hypothetical protein
MGPSFAPPHSNRPLSLPIFPDSMPDDNKYGYRENDAKKSAAKPELP